MKQMDIRSLKASQTYPLRQQILRPGYRIKDCCFPEDELETSRHFGAYQADKLVGIVSVLNVPEPLSSNKSEHDWQVRALATLPSVRGKGYAAALIDAAEHYVRKQSGRKIWCNARYAAAGFYQKQGYFIEGKPFEIAHIGQHFRMRKKL